MDTPKTQYIIWKDVDLRALKMDDSFITNWHIFPWTKIVSKPGIPSCSVADFGDMSNICFSVRSVVFAAELRLLSTFFSMNVADSIVTAINIHQKNVLLHFPYHWKFFPVLSHLISHPIHEWSWFYRQFQFCSIVSHDEILRSCHFLRIDFIRSSRSVTRCFLVPYGLHGSVEKNFLFTRSNYSYRSYVIVSVLHSWEDQARSSSNFA